MNEVWLSACQANNGIYLSVPSAVCLAVINYIDHPSSLQVNFADDGSADCAIFLPGEHQVLAKPDTVLTILPALVKQEGRFILAGLAAILRQIVKEAGNDWIFLLGFRASCLAAPAEVSLWTRFCEVDMVACASSPSQHGLPRQIDQIETHLSLPAKVHNISKYSSSPSHDFLEGPHFVLADIIVAICLHIIVSKIPRNVDELSRTPLTLLWFQRVMETKDLKAVLSCFELSQVECDKPREDWSQNEQVLGKKEESVDSKFTFYRTETKRKAFTQVHEVDESLNKISNIRLEPYLQLKNLEELEEKVTLPDVPEERLKRKKQQIVSLVRPVIDMARDGDVVVDFCCGSGHVGLVLAELLPCCRLILVDNKEKSLERARVRSSHLTNVTIVQANLHYFDANFQIGVSLHACGVASDLVLAKCLQRRAGVVLCPCCYGGIRTNHSVEYPQSVEFINSGLDERGLVVLGHCADTIDSDVGRKCMQAVDTDRCLLLADKGYSPVVYKLHPLHCTTRNNLIVAASPG